MHASRRSRPTGSCVSRESRLGWLRLSADEAARDAAADLIAADGDLDAHPALVDAADRLRAFVDTRVEPLTQFCLGIAVQHWAQSRPALHQFADAATEIAMQFDIDDPGCPGRDGMASRAAHQSSLRPSSPPLLKHRYGASRMQTEPE